MVGIEGKQSISAGSRMAVSKRIQDVIDLISNVMEAFTAAVFIWNETENVLKLYGFQSFSKNIIKDSQIGPGEGFVGWVFREQKNLLVKNFDRSTTTLKFYNFDEGIKSFLAVPLPEKKGVLCVDSKKSYSFTEEKEKIFFQFASIIWSVFVSEEEIINGAIYKKFISISSIIDDIIVKSDDSTVLIKDVLNIILRNSNAKNVFFVVPGICVYCSTREIPQGRVGFFSLDPHCCADDGLIGWVLNKRKTLLLENIVRHSEKSFVLNREEKVGFHGNFLGVPLYKAGANKTGALAVIKWDDQSWNKNESELIEKIAMRIFWAWSLSKDQF